MKRRKKTHRLGIRKKEKREKDLRKKKNGNMDEWTNRRRNERTHTHGRTDGRTDGWMDE